MLRFVRDVENWGGVQGTSWVASTEIAAMSWMESEGAIRLGPGVYFGTRRQESEIRLRVRGFETVASKILLSKEWQRKDKAVEKSDGSWREGGREKKGWRRKREGVTQQRREQRRPEQEERV